VTRALHVGKIVLWIIVLYFLVNALVGTVLYILGFPRGVTVLGSLIVTALIANRQWARITR